MEYIDLKTCCFHDSTIKDVSYANQTLVLDVNGVPGEDEPRDFKLEMKVDEYDFRIYRLKQYPRFHKVKLKGKEISLQSLKRLFDSGYVLRITDFLASTSSNLVIIDSDMFPYSPKPGVCNKIVLKLNYEYDYIVLKEKVEKDEIHGYPIFP